MHGPLNVKMTVLVTVTKRIQSLCYNRVTFMFFVTTNIFWFFFYSLYNVQ
jgi:hypothetical protein